MPLFEYFCENCGKSNEILMKNVDDQAICKFCESSNMKKLISAHSSMSGIGDSKIPGLGDTTCCGSSHNESNCAGPGSCCGKNIV